MSNSSENLTSSGDKESLTTDIVARLRQGAGFPSPWEIQRNAAEAADEIERLRAELATAQADMRERCAAVCEELASAVFHPTQTITDRCAAAIRAIPPAPVASKGESE